MPVLKPQSTHTSRESGILVWVDEEIWGHRFYNEQTPWLILLEFFALYRGLRKENRLFSEGPPDKEDGPHEDIIYVIPKLEHLRHIVFNNPYMRSVENNLQDVDKWKKWRYRIGGDRDYSYLESRFQDFSKLTSVVEFFRNTSIESNRNRRWSSKFVFPYGPDCLFADLRPKGLELESADRRFFARGGELLYLMFNRCDCKPELFQLIDQKLMDEDSKWNRLIRSLSPDTQHNTIEAKIGYLPYLKRPEYDNLAKDWLQILKLKLPGASALDPLMRITGIHMILYMLNRSQEVIAAQHDSRNQDEKLCFVLEIASPQKTDLFSLSKTYYNSNKNLSQRAITSYLKASVEADQEWEIVRNNPGRSLEFLKRKFLWRPKEEPRGESGDTIFEELRKFTLQRHKSHAQGVPSEWSRYIGLSIARRKAGSWYSPDDLFLKAIVFATVHERMEYRKFLKKIYEKYRIIIGVTEAKDAFKILPVDEKVFSENTMRLERRLHTLGLLKRLSDDCAYVQNPFSEHE